MSLEYLTVEHLTTKDLIRIFSKIEIHPDVSFNGTPCWIWCARRTSKEGYGVVGYTVSFKHTDNVKTHRLLFAWLIHRLPKGKLNGEIDHLCRNPPCCNPLHLEFVSTSINVRRGLNNPFVNNGRKTHCIRGHEFTGENTAMVRKGANRPLSRACKQCMRIHWTRRNQKLAYQRRFPDGNHHKMPPPS